MTEVSRKRRSTVVGNVTLEERSHCDANATQPDIRVNTTTKLVLSLESFFAVRNIFEFDWYFWSTKTQCKISNVILLLNLFTWSYHRLFIIPMPVLRVEGLRHEMLSRNLAAYIIPISGEQVRLYSSYFLSPLSSLQCLLSMISTMNFHIIFTMCSVMFVNVFQ